MFDTNVHVYSMDSREPAKRDRAREASRRAVRLGSAALPAQALSEYANVRLRKLTPSPDPGAVGREVERLLLAFPVLPLTGPVVLQGPAGRARPRALSYYYAQIWAIVRLGQVEVVLSEDFDFGAVLEGVRFANPLDPAFETSSLG